MRDIAADARPTSALEFLAKGGEMGARMRALDWSATPLGDPRHWPQSLKTIVRVMLDSRYAMWMAWGPALTFFCNDAYLPTVGIKRDWVLGSPADEVWKEIWPDIWPRIEHVLRDGEATWDEGLLLFLERSGFPEETYHTFSYSPVYDDGNSIAGMLCVVTEVTDRVIGERRLRLLRDLAAHLGGVGDAQDSCRRAIGVLAQYPFDIPFSAIYLADPAQQSVRLVASTRKLDELLLPGSASHSGPMEIWLLSDALRTHQRQHLKALTKHGISIAAAPWDDPIEQALVIPVRGSGQETLAGLVIAALSPRRALDAAYLDFIDLIIGQIGSAIADAQAYEAERARAEALAEIDRVKTAFFSNVSHEFRTPLTLMMGPLEDVLAVDASSLAPAIRQELQIVHRNGLRLMKLVNTLLEFSRLEAGRVKATYEPTDLARLSAELASTFRAAVERVGMRFELDFPPLQGTTFLDRRMWEQIVLNLLSNAFKYTLTGTIRVSVSESPTHARLAVTDTGSGIPPEAVPRLFERFYRVANAQGRTHEGTGIGLALVNELVKLHGGTIAVSSQLGVGSTFTVSIPIGCAHLPSDQVHDSGRAPAATAVTDAFVQEASQWAAPRGDQPMAVSAEESPAHAATVLLVDDNADMREYVRRLLAARFNVVTARDGLEALEHIARSLPDLVLSDIMMPRLDGFGLLRTLRAEPRTRALPVILLSARAGEEAGVEGLLAGADDYLVKPFTARELLARVATHISMARLREDAQQAVQAGEQARREAAEALNRQLTYETEELRRLFEQSPGFAAVLRGPLFTFELANAAYFELIGPRELIGRPLLEAIPEIATQPLPGLLQQVMQTGKPYIGRAVPVPLSRQRDAALEVRYLDFVYQPLLDRAGVVTGVFVQGNDVTERKLAEDELKAAGLRLEESDRRKNEFLAMLAHELRNPLAPIQTASELLARMHPEDSHSQQMAGIVRRQVKQLARLVDDLLDIARITEGRIQLERQSVALMDVINHALETVQPLMREKQHQVVTTSPAEPLYVNADVARLIQCVANILTNAAKYTDAAGQIDIELRSESAHAVLDISDNGVGIAPDLLPRIFELFVQGDRTLDRSQGGLGIGLSVVQRLVEMHGGSVAARSDGARRGSIFQIRLPLIAAPDARAFESEQAPVPARRVLVVDDNADAADSLAMMLELASHEVQSVYTARAALEQLTAFKPDVVLLDIGLPHMDGYEVARRMRAERKSAFLVAVSGYGQAEDKRRAQDAGFDAHFVKPLDFSSLERLLNNLDQTRTD
jgi:signal transduction histidine kinase/DNA-binding response OmpR family regulator